MVPGHIMRQTKFSECLGNFFSAGLAVEGDERSGVAQAFLPLAASEIVTLLLVPPLAVTRGTSKFRCAGCWNAGRAFHIDDVAWLGA